MTQTPDYLLIGHVTADLTPEGRSLGGTVSFGTRVANAFGLSVAALTSTGVGETLIGQLTPYADVMTRLGESTSTYENIYTPEGRIQYVRGVAEKLNGSHVPAGWLRAPLVHLAPLTDEVDPQIAHLFKDSTVLLTLQGWLRCWDADGRVRFKRWHDASVLESIDIVVFSEEDILEAPELEQEFAGTVEHLIVTRAERGGTYYHKGVAETYETPQVEMVNPTGAGDVFAAALLAGIHVLGGDMRAAIKVAALLGATSVTRKGLDSAPTPTEVQKALNGARQLEP
jgi:sugar/nucleoside kinase (ribokinase family)